MPDDIWGDDTTLLGNFARAYRKLEQERLANLKKTGQYVHEPVYQGTSVVEPASEVPLTC